MAESMIELVAFLGNPGKEYSRNRHNAGFLLAEKIKADSPLKWQKKFKGLYTAFDERVHFVKPQTYMNLSGQSVYQAASFFKIKTEAVLIVHDELELPLGTFSLKFGGGLGGHNGLRSMKAQFGSADFWRIRIGIGRPVPGGEAVIDWVLSDFDAAEREILVKVLDAAAELLMKVLSGNPEELLPEWAKKKVLLDG
jgi:PTH1 family peptidyl-tRNA hydrolase